MKVLFLAIALSALLSACVSVGKNFDESQLANIHKGSTTEQGVISYFGAPMSQTVDSDGNRILMWTYSHANSFGKAEGKTLMIQLSNGAVTNYTVSKTVI
ncbi:hypothetical protein H5A44_21455 [Pectobacterium brasiliense]|uniref:hypothetical protein n=1 Tax=Pectobacterium brasiliense TaxID=180957 RepID=UPI001969A4DA|nr:hypothetical protein [Pectobacterium brasiliense]MBN3344975.1 hypothetical protein [Pectobacterium brasiliense]